MKQQIEEMDAKMKARGMITVTDIIEGNTPMEGFRRHAGIKTVDDLLEWIMKKHTELTIMMARHELGEGNMEPELVDFLRGKSSAFGDMAANIRGLREGK